MMHRLVLASLLGVCPFFKGHGQPFNIVRTTAISFTISNLGISVNGHFTKIFASVKFDPNHPEASQFNFKVDATSITTGIQLRDKHLKGIRFFDTEKFPTMDFQSSSVQKTAIGKFNITGTLTIKNISRQISFSFTIENSVHECHFLGRFRVDRNDFSIGGKSITIGDDALVTVMITTKKQ